MGYQLTAHDIRALRHADSICFDMLPGGTGQLRAILRAENSPSGFEQTHTIEAGGNRLENFGSDEGPFTGFHMVMSSKYDDLAQTLIRRLRPGMEVHLLWWRDNLNNILRDAGLVCDELRVRIGKDTGPADTFLMDKAVREDNTARMITKARV